MTSAGPSDASRDLGIASEFDFMRGLFSLLSVAEVHGLSTTKGLIQTQKALRSHVSAGIFLQLLMICTIHCRGFRWTLSDGDCRGFLRKGFFFQGCFLTLLKLNLIGGSLSLAYSLGVCFHSNQSRLP